MPSDITNDVLVELLIHALPYPSQMSDLDTVSESNAIRFRWRSNNYRLSHSLMAEVRENGCLIGNDIAILMGELVNRAYLWRMEQQCKVSKG